MHQTPRTPFCGCVAEGLSQVDPFETKTAKSKKKKTAKNPVKLPNIILSNVHTLENKMEDLKTQLLGDNDYTRCDLMCFTETWQTDDSQADLYTLDGFNLICEKRHAGMDCSNLERGGGLIVYCRKGREIKKIDGLCEQFTKRKRKDKSCTEDVGYEIMPFTYTTAEHHKVVFILVYITGNIDAAKTAITKCYKELLQWSDGGPVFLLGDFNQCDFEGMHVGEKYVTCPTRGPNILDQCYGNDQGAYTSQCRRPLRSKEGVPSDHKVILLTPEQSICSHLQA